MNNPFEIIDARLSNIENLLLDLKHGTSSGSKPDPDQLLNIKEAAQLINLSVPTIYGLVASSKIPVCKKAKKLYFSKRELMDWIKSGRKKTNEEIDREAQRHLAKKK